MLIRTEEEEEEEIQCRSRACSQQPSCLGGVGVEVQRAGEGSSRGGEICQLEVARADAQPH